MVTVVGEGRKGFGSTDVRGLRAPCDEVIDLVSSSDATPSPCDSAFRFLPRRRGDEIVGFEGVDESLSVV